jgi:hypothetical protein
MQPGPIQTAPPARAAADDHQRIPRGKLRGRIDNVLKRRNKT